MKVAIIVGYYSALESGDSNEEGDSPRVTMNPF